MKYSRCTFWNQNRLNSSSYQSIYSVFRVLEIYIFDSRFSFFDQNSCETVCIIGRKINVLSTTTSQFYTVCWIDGTRAAQHLLVRGHSTTTWTKFYPILTTNPTRVDNYGHFTYHIFSEKTLPRIITAILIILSSRYLYLFLST